LGRERNERILTEFGATVLSLMAEKGVRTQGELVDLLEHEGLKVSQPGLSGWLYGRHGVQKEMPVALAEALKLDEKQRTRLALAFTYGQTKSITLAS
jgi:hypothetical protein